MNGRTLVVILLILFLFAFLSPATYWSMVYMSRTIFYVFVGFCLGYILAKLSNK